MTMKTKKWIVIIICLLWGAAYTVGFLLGPFTVVASQSLPLVAALVAIGLALPVALFYPAMRYSVLNGMKTAWRVVLGLLMGTLALGVSTGIVMGCDQLFKTVGDGVWAEIGQRLSDSLGFGFVLGALPGAVVSLALSLILVLAKGREKAE